MAGTNGASPAQLKQTVSETIDGQFNTITGIADRILRHPETGYKEFETAGVVDEWLTKLDIPHETGIALTGVKAVLDTGRPGPTVAIMGELDALPVPDHPHANPETGAAHACGHNNQIASMLGAAMGLTQSGAVDDLCGKLVFIAVPAEEYVEVGFRQSLRDRGAIEFLGGKPEFIRLGAFDDVDFAMMVHTTSSPEDGIGDKQRHGGEARHLSRPRGPCRRRAPQGHQRAERRDTGVHRDPIPARDFQGRGHRARPLHHQARRRGE